MNERITVTEEKYSFKCKCNECNLIIYNGKNEISAHFNAIDHLKEKHRSQTHKPQNPKSHKPIKFRINEDGFLEGHWE